MTEEPNKGDRAHSWLFKSPLDSEDMPRAVWLDRIIDGKKRRKWLWSAAKNIPVGVAIVVALYSIAKLLVERLPQ